MEIEGVCVADIVIVAVDVPLVDLVINCVPLCDCEAEIDVLAVP